MIAYLDTNVLIYLAEADRSRISKDAERMLREADLLLSPMVLLEIEYLYEKGRIQLSSRAIQAKIERETTIKICNLPFATISWMAIDEKWTRDAFDRIIVANAKANGLAFLISSDLEMAKHYPRTVW